MRVPDEFLKSVAVVASYEDDHSDVMQYDPEGTAFFVLHPAETPGRRFGYLVTARHVAEDLLGRPIDFIVNKRGGGVMPLSCPDTNWYFHPSDETADVAVTPFLTDPNLDIIGISTTSFVTKEDIARHNVGIGDDVFFPGVFTFVKGENRNMPLLRTGTIAMIPDAEIQVDSSFADVYLIEARSIGGISGSPVFVRRTIHIMGSDSAGNQIPLQGLSGGPVRLLGLIRGHWDIKESEINAVNWHHDAKRGVNLGIGVVIPAQKILDVINSPSLIEQRRAIESRW